MRLPRLVGETFTVRAAVVWTGRTSIRSHVELLIWWDSSGACMKGLLSSVAIDTAGHPIAVDPLLIARLWARRIDEQISPVLGAQMCVSCIAMEMHKK
jgi:acyl-CoA hydrolase